MTPQPQRTLDISRCYDCPHLRDGIRCSLTKQFIVDATKIPASCTLPTSRPAPSPLEKVLLCFGNYWECPIDEEECEVSDPCHQKAIRDMEHDKQVKRKAREEVLNEICVINKGDGCCNGQPHGKDCFDCAFIHLRSEVKKE